MQADNIHSKSNRKVEVEIKTKTGKRLIIMSSEGFRMKGTKSLFSYVDRFQVSYDDAQSDFFKDLNGGDEVTIATIDGATGARQPIFGGSLGTIRADFDNPKKVRIVTFDTASFAEELAMARLDEHEIHFNMGYGEVVKKLAAGQGPFDVTQVRCDNSSGIAYFDKISILDAMRTLAHVKGWCLGFEGRAITFAPCPPPTNSGITLTDKDIIRGHFEK
jgi:hypothetical protein